MRELYEGLVTRGKAQDSTKRIKYWGKWNNQLDQLKEGKTLGFALPAVFIEFVNTNEVSYVGGGVQVFDPVFVRLHVLHEFYNNTTAGTSLNLDFYDLGKTVHGWFEGYQVQGADYGSSPLNRTSVDEDEDHGNVYHYQPTYTTTWTDNSQKWPKGGYEQDPQFNAQITGSISHSSLPSLNANKGAIAFGNVAVGQSATNTFTLQGSGLTSELIISTTDGQFLITLATVYKTRIDMYPTNGVIDLFTVTVKFTPSSTGAKTGSILYGVPGTNGSVSLTGTGI